MIDCIIVDDEEHAINTIASYVSKTPFLHLVTTMTNPLLAIDIINNQKIDLVFLDIQMPEISGIDFIKAIKGKSKIILTTAYSEFAIEGYELDVVDYLLKPIILPRFIQAAQKALNQVTSLNSNNQKNEEILEDGFFFVKNEVKGKMLKINFGDIDYIESLKNYIAIHCSNRKILALQSLKEIEDRLPKKYFMRIHRSFIVPLRKIVGIEGNLVIIQNVKADILLGETYKPLFLERMKHTII